MFSDEKQVFDYDEAAGEYCQSLVEFLSKIPECLEIEKTKFESCLAKQLLISPSGIHNLLLNYPMPKSWAKVLGGPNNVELLDERFEDAIESYIHDSNQNEKKRQIVAQNWEQKKVWILASLHALCQMITSTKSLEYLDTAVTTDENFNKFAFTLFLNTDLTSGQIKNNPEMVITFLSKAKSYIRKNFDISKHTFSDEEMKSLIAIGEKMPKGDIPPIHLE